MYTVVGHPRSRTFRVLWALEELGLSYDVEPFKPQSPEVRALNGSGKIPVLKTPDGPVTDSVAILTHLADKHGGLTHAPGSIERARQDGVMQYLVADLDAALWLNAKHTFALPEDMRVPAVKPIAEKEFARALAHVEAQKGTAPFLAGDTFTICDIVLAHCITWGKVSGFTLPEGDFGAYIAGLFARDGFKRAAVVQAEKSA